MRFKTAGRSGPVQIIVIHTNQGWNTIKGSKDQTDTDTLSHDKASRWKNKAISFPTKIKLYLYNH